MEAGEIGDDILRDAVAEIQLCRITAEISERHDSNRHPTAVTRYCPLATPLLVLCEGGIGDMINLNRLFYVLDEVWTKIVVNQRKDFSDEGVCCA